jgi:hypothetical protein
MPQQDSETAQIRQLTELRFMNASKNQKDTSQNTTPPT